MKLLNKGHNNGDGGPAKLEEISFVMIDGNNV
jgi:hypothetical protein